MADKSAVARVEPIKAHFAQVLRDKGHTVKKVIRVFSPGDEGAWDGFVTVEFVNVLGEHRTAIFWLEDRKLKAGPVVKEEKVRTYAGWQGMPGWEDPS